MPRRRSPYTPYISSHLPVSPQVIKKNCTFDINRRGGMSTPLTLALTLTRTRTRNLTLP